jgi:hypothetical protein
LRTEADTLTDSGRELTRASGGLERAIPPIPEDEHGLGLLFVSFDEARESFERRAGDTVASAGATLSLLALAAQTADEQSPFAHLPTAGT